MGKAQVSFLALLAVAAITLYTLSDKQRVYNKDFQLWKSKYNKQYSSAEESYRVGIWLKNLEFVQNHNQRFQKGFQSYEVEMNDFADLTSEEFGAKYLTTFNTQKGSVKHVRDTSSCSGKAPSSNMPSEIDWTNKGAVTGVKSQGQCGSCWAFSTTGSLQGAYFLSGNKITQFSQQQLVDCSHKYGNNGCKGGLMNTSFWYIKDHGITTQDKYPYKAVKQTCSYSPSDKIWSISNCYQIQEGSEKALKIATAQQPVSVAVHAGILTFQFYRSGIYSDSKCGTDLDHGVLVVGYGTQDGKNFWKIKNSWTDKWGEQGYIRMLRTGDGPGLCGIQLAASIPNA